VFIFVTPMNVFTKLRNHYADIEIDIKRLIAAEFFLQVINSAFTISLNIYLSTQGYSDAQIAAFTADRFIAVMLFALPFGIYIKGKALRPIFLSGVLAMPLVSLALLEAIAQHADFWLRLLLITWGICFTTLAIPSLPYILRNALPDTHTRAISLHAATWSMGLIFAGLLIFILSHLWPPIFHEKMLMQVLTLIGAGAIWFILKMSKDEKLEHPIASTAIAPQKNTATQVYAPIPAANTNTYGTLAQRLRLYISQLIKQYDWILIGRAIIPTTLIAVGAGLTIPFMNLFFYHRFGVNTNNFALLGAITACLVFVSTLLVPRIKNRLGYKAIPITQSFAIASLVLLGMTDQMTHFHLALPLALFCFTIRQPLMSLANPMTSELTMYYVGNHNRELMGAIVSAIWSGSWFISSYLFGVLRGMGLPYGSIFFITATFYMVGVLTYIVLIKDFNRREKAGLIIA
jgi:MFS family permease